MLLGFGSGQALDFRLALGFHARAVLSEPLKAPLSGPKNFDCLQWSRVPVFSKWNAAPVQGS